MGQDIELDNVQGNILITVGNFCQSAGSSLLNRRDIIQQQGTQKVEDSGLDKELNIGFPGGEIGYGLGKGQSFLLVFLKNRRDLFFAVVHIFRTAISIEWAAYVTGAMIR